MNVDSLDQETVSLLAQDFSSKQEKDMTLFTITRLVFENATSQNGIRMKMTMKRKIMSEMMTTYFPSLLLMMITYATTFFKPFFFEAALSVNLTTMLVMTTIFISKMEGLPPTSATKMIDCWLILCQLLPFVQVVIVTAMENLGDERQDPKDSSGQYETDNRERNVAETREGWDIPQKNTRFMVPMLKYSHW